MAYAFHLNVDDVRFWADVYLKKNRRLDDEAFAAGKRIREGAWTRKNVEVIVDWKSSRRKALIALNSDAEIQDALRLALIANEPRSALGVLMSLNGVGVPMASAILTAIDQEKYTVIDYRALEALNVPDVDYKRLDFYLLNYLPECKLLAKENNVDLRTLDRALWAWSEAKGIRN